MSIDSVSTHKFLHKRVARPLGLPIKPGSTLQVMVARGEKLHSKGMWHCVPFRLHDSPLQVDFLLFVLEDCVAVLGAQWLEL